MDKGNGLPDEYIDQAYSYIPNTNPNISLPLKKKKIRQYVITNSDIFIERELDYECGMTLEDIIDPDYNGEEEPEIQYFFDPPKKDPDDTPARRRFYRDMGNSEEEIEQLIKEYICDRDNGLHGSLTVEMTEDDKKAMKEYNKFMKKHYK